ncbi:MAG: N-acetyl-gamma-glutamyl-phosphate reductase [Phycisphaerales bacterium]
MVGASGYSGIELATILLRHPHAEIVGLFGSSRRAAHHPAAKGPAGGSPVEPFADLAPSLRGRLDLAILPVDVTTVASLKPDAVFLCTPHEASLELTPELRRRGLTVLDLSGAFRLKDRALYPKHYGFEHTEPDLLAQAVYGLPELPTHSRGTGVRPVQTSPPASRTAIAQADLIAVPGCYPTAAILPLAPLARAGAGRPGTRAIIDSTSGVSGAGRGATAKTHFCEVSLQPYNVLKHRHNPEIDAYAGTPTVFTPHLGPFDRGILSTIHVELADGWTGDSVRDTLAAAYDDEPFIRLLPADAWPSVAAVERSNFCDIALAVDEPHHHLILVSAIDNLTKGAAGQAVQCMNIRFGLAESTALR